MLKVKVKDFPVFYAGKRYEQNDELIIENTHKNEKLFEILEDVEDNPFKGVKETTLKKALTEAGVEIPEGADRAALIELMEENELTV